MFVPLKECPKEDVYAVGLRAQVMGIAVTQLKTPFTLVLTSDLFNHFIEHNGLFGYMKQAKEATTTDMQISLFNRFQEEVKKGRFTEGVLGQIRECFELMCLDTQNLGKKAPHCILSIQRSTDYKDKDLVTPTLAFATNNFDQFVTAIKQVIASAFTPAAIASRIPLGVSEFTMAFIVTRIPSFSSILEVRYEQNKELAVGSYIGFIDPGKVVPRDRFTLTEEFLRISQSQITDQRQVCIFDIDKSTVVYKEFDRGSSQSSPNQIILEAGRYAKRIRELNNATEVHAILLSDGQQIYILSARAFQTSKEQQKAVARQKLAQELISFFKVHPYQEFASQLLQLQAKLQNNPSPADVKEALELSLAIMKFEK